jgi:uroporphyrinogen decarboxylase
VADAVSLIRRELQGRVPLIGFSGSPWTLACYMISGGSSGDDFLSVRKWLYSRPDLVHSVIDRLTQLVIDYCDMQVRSGAQAIMLFDSWGGLLADAHFEKFSRRSLQTIVETLRQRHPDTPTIVFVKGGGQWLESIAATGCDAVGCDWTVNLAQARARVGDRVALQGNLDPAVLLGSPEHVEVEVARVIESFGQRGPGVGHVFNLGHGISQFTPLDNVSVLVETVAKVSRRLA